MIDQDIITSVDHRLYSRERTNNEKHDYKTKLMALSVYAETGSQQAASEATGVPRNTIHYWLKEEGADAYVDELRTAIKASCAHKYVKAAILAADNMIERLENGDEHFDSKSNSIVRLKVKAKDCAAIASICTDKHALLTGAVQASKATDALTVIAGKLLDAMKTLPNKQATAPD